MEKLKTQNFLFSRERPKFAKQKIKIISSVAALLPQKVSICRASWMEWNIGKTKAKFLYSQAVAKLSNKNNFNEIEYPLRRSSSSSNTVLPGCLGRPVVVPDFMSTTALKEKYSLVNTLQ